MLLALSHPPEPRDLAAPPLHGFAALLDCSYLHIVCRYVRYIIAIWLLYSQHSALHRDGKVELGKRNVCVVPGHMVTLCVVGQRVATERGTIRNARRNFRPVLDNAMEDETENKTRMRAARKVFQEMFLEGQIPLNLSLLGGGLMSSFLINLFLTFCLPPPLLACAASLTGGRSVI